MMSYNECVSVDLLTYVQGVPEKIAQSLSYNWF